MSAEQADLAVTSMTTKTLTDQPVLRVTGIWPCRDGEVATAIEEVNQARQRQGLAQAGPPYWSCAPGGKSSPGRWEAGIPVGRPGTTDGRVEPGVLPGGEVASIYYQGNYMAPGREAAVDAYLLREIGAAGLAPAGDPRWIYLTAPEQTPDPENHYSEVICPVTR